MWHEHLSNCMHTKCVGPKNYSLLWFDLTLITDEDLNSHKNGLDNCSTRVSRIRDSE